jgi:hypothetical protein
MFTSAPYHIGSANTYEPEYYCVKVEPNTVSQNDAELGISDALYYSNPAEDWQGLNHGKVDFIPVGSPCPWPIHYYYPWFIKFTIVDGPACDHEGWLGCADGENPTEDDPLSGHPEYKHYFIQIADGSLNRHVVNHEIGHVLGLDDGGPQWDPPSSCENGQGIPSIMHDRGCTRLDWPSSADRITVDAHIPDVASASGGGKGYLSSPL